MKNKILFILCLFCAFLLVSCGGNEDINNSEDTSSGAIESSTSEKELIAYVKSIKGSPKNTLNDSVLKEGDTLYVGDVIETGSGSEITMVMSDHSIFRLNSDSKFIFESIEGKDTNIKLEKGSVWGRVLKSVTSEEVVNIENNGVTAAIVGTSVLYEAGEDSTKKPKVTVVDSYNEVDGKEGIVINSNGKEYKVLPEQFINFNVVPRPFKMADIYKGKPIITNNSKKDLIYMTEVTEKAEELTQGVIEKINGEISVTTPTEEELEDFFNSPELLKSITDKEIDNISELIIKDQVITNVKINLNGTDLSGDEVQKYVGGFINDILDKDFTAEGFKVGDISEEYTDIVTGFSENLLKDFEINLDLGELVDIGFAESIGFAEDIGTIEMIDIEEILENIPSTEEILENIPSIEEINANMPEMQEVPGIEEVNVNMPDTSNMGLGDFY